MDNPFPRYDLFSCELGMENDGYDDNNDNDENITIGSLEDFADLIFFLFSWNAFKNPNGIIDGRPKTCFWLRPAVWRKAICLQGMFKVLFTSWKSEDPYENSF